MLGQGTCTFAHLMLSRLASRRLSKVFLVQDRNWLTALRWHLQTWAQSISIVKADCPGSNSASDSALSWKSSSLSPSIRNHSCSPWRIRRMGRSKCPGLTKWIHQTVRSHLAFNFVSIWSSRSLMFRGQFFEVLYPALDLHDLVQLGDLGQHGRR